MEKLGRLKLRWISKHFGAHFKILYASFQDFSHFKPSKIAQIPPFLTQYMITMLQKIDFLIFNIIKGARLLKKVLVQGISGKQQKV